MKFLGSKTIETERLVLKAQTMDEQHYLWSVLMLPEVNRYYLTVPKKLREKLKDWDKQKEFYASDMLKANDKDVFRWSVFLKDTGECIGRVSCQEAKNDGYEVSNPSYRGVGWYIDPKHKGHGYGKEAAFAMMDYMFDECEIDAILTGAAVINKSSWSIMEKYGFERQDKTKMVEYTFLDEPIEDYQYVLTKEMYYANKNSKVK